MIKYILWDFCKGNTQKLRRSAKLRRLCCSAKPPLRPAKPLRSAKPPLRPAKPPLRPAKPPLHPAKPPLRSALRIQPHWFIHASPPPVRKTFGTLRTLLFMVPLLFIIIISRHSARPRAFLYMYHHQHGIPILSSSDPLLGVLIM